MFLLERPVDWRLQGDVIVGEPPHATRRARARGLARARRRRGPVSEPAPPDPPDRPAARSGLHRLLQAGEFVVTAELQATDWQSQPRASPGRWAPGPRGRRELHGQQLRARTSRTACCGAPPHRPRCRAVHAARVPGPEPARAPGRHAGSGGARGSQHRVHDRRRCERGG